MSDDLIERLDALQRRIFGQRRCNDQDAATVREARSALTAAQARIAELESERDAAHERGRLQGLDEAVEVAKATEERCLRQRGDGPPLNAIDRENRLDWYNRSRGAKMTAESIIALKTKGGE